METAINNAFNNPRTAFFIIPPTNPLKSNPSLFIYCARNSAMFLNTLTTPSTIFLTNGTYFLTV